jgi:hypothetical protein
MFNHLLTAAACICMLLPLLSTSIRIIMSNHIWWYFAWLSGWSVTSYGKHSSDTTMPIKWEWHQLMHGDTARPRNNLQFLLRWIYCAMQQLFCRSVWLSVKFFLFLISNTWCLIAFSSFSSMKLWPNLYIRTQWTWLPKSVSEVDRLSSSKAIHLLRTVVFLVFNP